MINEEDPVAGNEQDELEDVVTAEDETPPVDEYRLSTR
jgi:hypothetical protein